MAPPKSILKKPSGTLSNRKAPVTGTSSRSAAGPSKSAGSSSKSAGPSKSSAGAGSKKPKQSISLAQKKGKKPEGVAGKGKKVEKAEEEDDDMDGDESDDGFGDEEDEEMGTDEEIERAQSKGGKVKPAVKRKRPTTADEFGSALTSLLGESSRPTKSKKTAASTTATEAEPSVIDASKPILSETKKNKKSAAQPILSLSRAKLPVTANTEKLERQAARAVRREKEENEDRARVKDVVEGWSHSGAKEGEVIGGLEFEKGLRKTAQRGVIKLFNAILTASRQDDNAADDPASVIAKSAAAAGVKGYGKKDKDNIMGRGGKEELTKEGFLDLVKRGSGR